MGLVKNLRITIDLADGHKVVGKMLSHFELEDAREAKFQKMRSRMAALKDIRDAIPARTPTNTDVAAAVDEDPLLQLDIRRVLEIGVVSWDYTDNDGKPEQLDVSQFDDDSAVLVARAIARFSKPSMAELGKGSSSSTGT